MIFHDSSLRATSPVLQEVSPAPGVAAGIGTQDCLTAARRTYASPLISKKTVPLQDFAPDPSQIS